MQRVQTFSFHDAVLDSVVLDRRRDVWICLSETKSPGGFTTIHVRGSTGVTSSGHIEVDWFLSDVEFIGPDGPIPGPWEGWRPVIRTIVLGTDGSMVVVSGGEVAFADQFDPRGLHAAHAK